MTTINLESELERLCTQVFQSQHSIEGLKRLTGGANAETWAFDFGPNKLILRRNAGEVETTEASEAIGFDVEAKLIQKAADCGVNTPRIFAVTSSTESIGESVLMERVEGEALPQRLFKNEHYQPALAQLTQDCARSMANIHSMPQDDFVGALTRLTPSSAVEKKKHQYRQYGFNSPILSYALYWLEQNAPSTSESVVCHGDFRLGNLLINESGISAVLDWELAHIGDPVSDIAYLCSPPWRFGNYDRTVGGFGDLSELIDTYETETGRQIEKARFQWWLVYASVEWSLACIYMARLWRNGADRELERAVIGTRVSESEIDLLLMFDDIHSFDDSLQTPKPFSPSTCGETEYAELSQALTEWVTDDVLPAASGRDNFKAKVARNALGILQRATLSGPKFSTMQAARLADLGLGLDELSDSLLQGRLSLKTESIRHHLKLTALERVLIDQPKHAGLKIALKKWGVK